MPKSLIRIVALLLVPCVLQQAALSSEFATFSHKTVVFSPFVSQALSAPSLEVGRQALAEPHEKPALMRAQAAMVVEGWPLIQVTERALWVAHVIGDAFGLRMEHVADVISKTDVHFSISSAQSYAGDGRIQIYRTGDIKESEAARSLMLTLASEMGHRFHQVLVESRDDTPSDVAVYVAEAFDAISRIIIAFAISPNHGAEELASMRGKAHSGRQLFLALKRMGVPIDAFIGGDGEQSKQVLNEVALLLKRSQPQIDAFDLHEHLSRITNDLFRISEMATAPLAYPGAHLFGAWIVRDVLLRGSKKNWFAAARSIGRSLVSEGMLFDSFENFTRSLIELNRREIPISLRKADDQSDNREIERYKDQIRGSVHNALADPILLPAYPPSQNQAKSISLLAAEAAIALADEVTGRHFPGETIETIVIDDFLSEEELFRPVTPGLFIKGLFTSPTDNPPATPTDLLPSFEAGPVAVVEIHEDEDYGHTVGTLSNLLPDTKVVVASKLYEKELEDAQSQHPDLFMRVVIHLSKDGSFTPEQAQTIFANARPGMPFHVVLTGSYVNLLPVNLQECYGTALKSLVGYQQQLGIEDVAYHIVGDLVTAIIPDPAESQGWLERTIAPEIANRDASLIARYQTRIEALGAKVRTFVDRQLVSSHPIRSKNKISADLYWWTSLKEFKSVWDTSPMALYIGPLTDVTLGSPRPLTNRKAAAPAETDALAASPVTYVRQDVLQGFYPESDAAPIAELLNYLPTLDPSFNRTQTNVLNIGSGGSPLRGTQVLNIGADPERDKVAAHALGAQFENVTVGEMAHAIREGRTPFGIALLINMGQWIHFYQGEFHASVEEFLRDAWTCVLSGGWLVSVQDRGRLGDSQMTLREQRRLLLLTIGPEVPTSILVFSSDGTLDKAGALAIQKSPAAPAADSNDKAVPPKLGPGGIKLDKADEVGAGAALPAGNVPAAPASLVAYAKEIGASFDLESNVPVMTLNVDDKSSAHILKLAHIYGPDTVFRIINSHFVPDAIQFGTDKARADQYDFRQVVDGAGYDVWKIESGVSVSDVFAGIPSNLFLNEIERDGYKSQGLGLPEDRSAILIYDSTRLEEIKETDGYRFIDPLKKKEALLGVLVFRKEIQSYERQLDILDSEDSKIAFLEERIAKAATPDDLRELNYISVTLVGWLYDESLKNADRPMAASQKRIEKMKGLANQLSNAEKMIEIISNLAHQVEMTREAFAKKDEGRMALMKKWPDFVIEEANNTFLDERMNDKFRTLLQDVKADAILCRDEIAQHGGESSQVAETRPSSPGQFLMPEPLKAYYADHLPMVEKAIETYMDQYLSSIKDERLAQAMIYSVSAGGKRMRPILVIAAAECFGTAPELVLPTAVAVELIQTFSLIHDDLPALDNDDYRRGRLSSHKAFDEATAILAGDALHTLAFELISSNDVLTGIPAERVLKAARYIAKAVGALGIIGGESLDILMDQGRWRRLPTEESKQLVRAMNLRKTAVFFSAPLQAGAILAGASDEQVARLGLYGEQIGEAFQIADDLRDRKEDEELLSYPNALGVEESIQLAVRLLAESKETLLSLGLNTSTDILRHVADYVSNMVPHDTQSLSLRAA